MDKVGFMRKSYIVHHNTYNYDLVDYINMKTNITILCKIHGEFNQRPDHHLNGSICPKCNIESRTKKLSSNKETFIKKSNIVHDYIYNYEDVVYTNAHDKVDIICREHGVFKQTPNSHLNGNGCPKCGFVNMGNKRKMKLIDLIKKSKDIHGDKYDYSRIKYIKSIDKVEILCKIHNKIFLKSPNNHISKKQGCPYCKESMGEKEVTEILDNNSIKYEKQKIFDDCKDKRYLPFDFYLPEHNMCIEYDGLQHFKPIEYFGGKETFNITKKHDKIKNEYCKNNGINLLRIKYNEVVSESLNDIL